MNKKVNIINNVILLIITVGAVLTSAIIGNNAYGDQTGIFAVAGLYIAGAIVFGFINALVHEWGHVIAGKKNGFEILSVTVWFFRFTRRKGRLRTDFVMIGEEAGYTEMLPKNTDNLAVRLKKATRGGIIASLIMAIISIAPMFMSSFLPGIAYYLISVFFPVSVYYLFGSALPMSSGGVLNDGAVVRGLNKNDLVSQVTVGLLKIHSELYSGKRPSEIDEKMYFDLPQLAEDELYFIMLLNARYAYYLDKGDLENAKKTSDRLLGLIDYMPANIKNAVKTDALYNACTFDYNEETADNLMYELDKYLNNVNTATNVRAKLAYLIYVRKEKENAETLYKKAVREAEKCPVKGLGRYEKALLEKMEEELKTDTKENESDVR